VLFLKQQEEKTLKVERQSQALEAKGLSMFKVMKELTEARELEKEQQETLTATTLLQVISLLTQLIMRQNLKALVEDVRTQVAYCLQHLKEMKAELQKQLLKQLTQQS
jgi:regulator of RNase E activity RraB